MSEQNEWAPEPITCENGHLYGADGDFLVSPDYNMEQATGDRLAACYNACAGVPTERLLREAHGTHSVACTCGYIHRYTPPERGVSHMRFGCRWCGEVVGVDIAKEAPDDSGRTPAGD